MRYKATIELKLNDAYEWEQEYVEELLLELLDGDDRIRDVSIKSVEKV